MHKGRAPPVPPPLISRREIFKEACLDVVWGRREGGGGRVHSDNTEHNTNITVGRKMLPRRMVACHVHRCCCCCVIYCTATVTHCYECYNQRMSLLRPGMGANYCDEYVCLLVCPFVCLSTRITRKPSELHQIYELFAYGPRPVLLWRRCYIRYVLPVLSHFVSSETLNLNSVNQSIRRR